LTVTIIAATSKRRWIIELSLVIKMFIVLCSNYNSFVILNLCDNLLINLHLILLMLVILVVEMMTFIL